MSEIGDIVAKRFPNGLMGNKPTMFTYRFEQSEDGLRLRMIFAETFVIEINGGDAYEFARRVDDATRQMAYIPNMNKGTDAAKADPPIGERFQIPSENARTEIL